MSGRLGELLVRENLISVQQLRKAQEEQQRSGSRMGTALIKTGAIEEHKLTDFLSKQYGVPAINLKDFDIDPEIIKLVKKDVAQKHVVIPVNRAGPSLIVAMADPSNIFAVDDLKFLAEEDGLVASTRISVVADSAEGKGHESFSEDLFLAMTGKEYSAASGTQTSKTLTLTLAPGKWSLAVSVADLLENRTGITRTTVVAEP